VFNRFTVKFILLFFCMLHVTTWQFAMILPARNTTFAVAKSSLN